jgi:hypothetical protein
MKFIEMTGKSLAQIVNAGETKSMDLEGARVTDETIVRVNEHGDIEVRRADHWDLIGGLLGDYSSRVKQVTGLEWIGDD